MHAFWAIWTFPWTYSFLGRTLKVANCCDRPEQSIGHLSLAPTYYCCTCLRAAVLCGCGRNIRILYRAHKRSGRVLRQVQSLTCHQGNICACLQHKDNRYQSCIRLSSYNKSPYSIMELPECPHNRRVTYTSIFFCHLILPLLNQLPHLLTYAPHFAMAKLISLLN